MMLCCICVSSACAYMCVSVDARVADGHARGELDAASSDANGVSVG